MIIHILIPHFWIIVEEQRRPDLLARPVIIGDGFMEKRGGHVKVLMANAQAESFGVRSGITLAHARQLCPEAVILSPELPLYAGVWDDVMALLLTYTPLVESLGPGEAVCDVTGCERLFGAPVPLAQEITRQIECSAGLPARAGVGSNRLVAELAAHSNLAGPGGELYPGVRYVPPGREAAFLAPFPVTSLPEVDPDTLLAFQVLGLKTVEHLTRISEKAFEKRFGPLGRRLARYARGRDNRPVSPAAQAPAMRAVKRCDDDAVDGLEPDQALARLIDLLAADLSDVLRKKHLAGRLIVLLVRAQRNSAVMGAKFRVLGAENSRPPMRVGLRSAGFGPADETHPSARTGRQRPAVDISSPAEKTESQDQFFPNQDSRIHSMLPQPPQSGRGRSLTPPSSSTSRKTATTRDSRLADSLPGTTVRALARMATGRPVNDRRTLSELGHRLLLRVLAEHPANELVAAAGAELCLEISHFAPPEQMLLPGLDGRPTDKRLERLYRQENILAARFGATPFRHLAAVDLDSVLSERIFRWGDGMS